MPSVPNRPFGHLVALSGVISQAKIVREAWSGLKTWGLGLLLSPHHQDLWSLLQRKARGCFPMVKTLSPNSRGCQAQPHSLLNSVSASLTTGVCQLFRAGGCRATEPTKWRVETLALLCSSSAVPHLGHMAPCQRSCGALAASQNI